MHRQRFIFEGKGANSVLKIEPQSRAPKIAVLGVGLCLLAAALLPQDAATQNTLHNLARTTVGLFALIFLIYGLYCVVKTGDAPEKSVEPMETGPISEACLKARLSDIARDASQGLLSTEEIARMLNGLVDVPVQTAPEHVEHLGNTEPSCISCRKCQPSIGERNTSGSWMTCSEGHECDKKGCTDYVSRYLTFPLTVKGIDIEPMAIPAAGKRAELVKVRLAGEDSETHLGFLLHDIGSDVSVSYNRDTEILRVMQYSTPPIFVPALGRIVYGCESWWSRIRSEEEFSDITDADIANQWYVQAWKAMTEEKEETKNG